MPVDNRCDGECERRGSRPVQFSLKSLIFATVILAIAFSLICLWEGFAWLAGAWIIGAVTGRVVAGQRLGWFIGSFYGTVASGATVVVAAAVWFNAGGSTDGGAVTLAILAGHIPGALIGGVIGGRAARSVARYVAKTANPQRNVSSSLSRAASTEKEM